MDRSLLIVNSKGKSLLLEGNELIEFEEKFIYLYDEERRINIIQPIDSLFLARWNKYDQEKLSEINQKDAKDVFKKDEFVSLEYNLNPLAISIRLHHNPKLLTYINENRCSLSEAVEKTEQSHLWA